MARGAEGNLLLERLFDELTSGSVSEDEMKQASLLMAIEVQRRYPSPESFAQAFAGVAQTVLAMEHARSLGPPAAALVDVDGGWDVMMGNVVLGDSGAPTCTAHGPMDDSGTGTFECAECGARAAYAA